MTFSTLSRQFSHVEHVFQDRFEHLSHCFHNAPRHGLRLEFGVWEGKTINFLAKLDSNQLVWGFDSFQGLPDDWVRSFDGKKRSPKGAFALKELPIVEMNVKLVTGWFEQTLPNWKEFNPGPISLLHIDCDLQSSTSTVLEGLNDRIVPGTIIVFDELCDWKKANIYERWREGEWKALLQWCRRHKRKVIAYSRTNWIEGAVLVQR